MANNRGIGVGSKALGTIAAFAAAFAARKLLTYGWKQITGKEPPSDPSDPRVGIGEAVGWAVVLGVGIETARLLVMRAAARKIRETEAADPG
jgi:hypothetical protein